MKEKLKNSGQSKRYLFYIYLFGALYLASILVFFFIQILVFGLDNIYGWYGFTVNMSAFSLVFLPVIIGYFIKYILLIKAAKNYISYKATVIEAKTPQYLRSDCKYALVIIDDSSMQVNLKVYKGKLYDEIYKGVRVEIAYNQVKQYAILIDVL